MKGWSIAYSKGTWFAREVRQDPVTKKRKQRWLSLGIRGIGNRAKAERAFRVLLVELSRTATPLTAMSVGRFVTQYLEAVRPNIRPDTHRSYALWLPKFGADFEDVPLADITPQHVEQWKGELVKKGYSPATVNIALRSLRVAMQYAVTHGLISKSPAMAVRFVDVPKHDFPPFWTQEQFERFLSTVTDARHRAAFCLSFYAGLRIRETVQLTWSDVKGNHLLIASRETARTKSDRSRKVPLCDQLREALAVLPRSSEYVLSAKNIIADERALSKAFLRYVREYRKADPSLPEISVHKLRHSFATAMAPHVTLPVLQRILGHAQITTTMIYAHVQDDVALDAANAANPFSRKNSD